MEKSQIDVIKSYLEFAKSSEFGPVLNEDFNVKSNLSFFLIYSIFFQLPSFYF